MSECSRYAKEAQRIDNESRQTKKRNTLMNQMLVNKSKNSESITQDIYQRVRKERQRLETSVKFAPMQSEDFDGSMVKSVRENQGLLNKDTDRSNINLHSLVEKREDETS